VQVDLADFPMQRTLELNWTEGEPSSFLIDHKGARVELAAVQAVWWRRVTNFGIDPSIGHGERSAFAHSETCQAVYGMLDSLNCAWVNPRESDATAQHKPFQWTVAHRIGLRLPRTLVTNDLYLRGGQYEYANGFNWRAIAALAVGSAVALMGLVIPSVRFLYDYSWFVGFAVAFVVYWGLMGSKQQLATGN